MLVSGINVDLYTITLIWILPSPLDTGHAQYHGKIYCPNEAGQVQQKGPGGRKYASHAGNHKMLAITLIWILPSPLDTGHAQYRGKIYYPNEAEQVLKEEWMAVRKAEAAAKKAQCSCTLPGTAALSKVSQSSRYCGIV